MKITRAWLEKENAWADCIVWWEGCGISEGVDVVEKLIKEDKLLFANWFIVRIMAYKQRVGYAVFAAEQVIGIYEKKYPGDDRPRKAIEAAKLCINNVSKKNKRAAHDAAREAAKSAAHSADVSLNAVNSAHDAHEANFDYSTYDPHEDNINYDADIDYGAAFAAHAAYDAVCASINAAHTAHDTFNSIYDASRAVDAASAKDIYAVDSDMKKKILTHGIQLLKGEGL